MADYRDVESLGQYLFRMADDDRVKDPYKRAKIHAYRDAFTRLLALPTIPTELKIGRWETDKSGHDAICTNCRKYWIPVEDKYDYWFCPRCGAKMEAAE